MNNIRSLGAFKNDATLMTPTDALREALSDIAKGAVKPTKLIVVMLDDKDEQYSTRFVQAGMKLSEAVALLDIMKDVLKEKMGF